jgi:hypothetical protein
MSAPSTSLNDSLLNQYGPLIGGAQLRQALGYPSTPAFSRAVRKGIVGVNVFKIPGRRGTFALTCDVAEWLKSLQESSASQKERQPRTRRANRGDAAM